MEGTFIEIMAYGDYDIKYTKCIMYSQEKRDVKTLKQLYIMLWGFTNFFTR